MSEVRLYTCDMKITPFEKRRRLLGAIYGAAGGAVFALMTWGGDALGLASAHVGLPFGKFIPGLLAGLLLGTLTGWLSARVDKAFVSFLLWIGLSVALVWLLLFLQFDWMPQLIRIFEPAPYWENLNYPEVYGLGQAFMVGSIGLAILAGIAGLIEGLLIESAMQKQGAGGIVGMILVVGFLLGVSGYLMDNLIHPNFRDSAKGLDSLIHYAVSVEGQEVDPIVARAAHLKTMTDLGAEVFTRPHRLIVQSYDPVMLFQVDYIVDFGGELYSCTTVGNIPVYCKLLL